jgi:hypothetical protein
LKYREIELADSVNLYNSDKRCGVINERVVNSLDTLIDLLTFNNHRILSKYFNSTTKVLIDFNCNHTPHWITPNKYKQGRGCPKCSDIIKAVKQSKRAKDEFLMLLVSNGHLILSEYVNAKTKVLIHYDCEHEPHWVTPNNYKKENGSGCPKCSGKCPKQSKEDLINLIKENNHILLSDYINVNTKVLIDFQCEHNHHWILPSKYKIGRGCPICSESRGEKRIREWLSLNNVEFESQKEFSELKGVGSGNLSYDFYIPNKNLLIEYQGEFHDGKANDYVRENLEIQQEHDKRKREYAKQNNINLLEIWYWDYENIVEILTNYFNKE